MEEQERLFHGFIFADGQLAQTKKFPSYVALKKKNDSVPHALTCIFFTPCACAGIQFVCLSATRSEHLGTS